MMPSCGNLLIQPDGRYNTQTRTSDGIACFGRLPADFRRLSAISAARQKSSSPPLDPLSRSHLNYLQVVFVERVQPPTLLFLPQPQPRSEQVRTVPVRFQLIIEVIITTIPPPYPPPSSGKSKSFPILHSSITTWPSSSED